MSVVQSVEWDQAQAIRPHMRFVGEVHATFYDFLADIAAKLNADTIMASPTILVVLQSAKIGCEYRQIQIEKVEAANGNTIAGRSFYGHVAGIPFSIDAKEREFVARLFRSQKVVAEVWIKKETLSFVLLPPPPPKPGVSVPRRAAA